MRKNLLLLTFFLISIISNAQISENYKLLSKAKNANYYDIIENVRAEFASKDLSILKNKKAKKQFERWAYYWENKVNKDGTFPNENAGYFNVSKH